MTTATPPASTAASADLLCLRATLPTGWQAECTRRRLYCVTVRAEPGIIGYGHGFTFEQATAVALLRLPPGARETLRAFRAEQEAAGDELDRMCETDR